MFIPAARVTDAQIGLFSLRPHLLFCFSDKFPHQGLHGLRILLNPRCIFNRAKKAEQLLFQKFLLNLPGSFPAKLHVFDIPSTLQFNFHSLLHADTILPLQFHIVNLNKTVFSNLDIYRKPTLLNSTGMRAASTLFAMIVQRIDHLLRNRSGSNKDVLFAGFEPNLAVYSHRRSVVAEHVNQCWRRSLENLFGQG